MKQVSSLRYGVIFKKAFSQPDIFKAFVKDFLDIELDIDVVETEKSFSPSIGTVDSHFDLFAEDKKHRTIVDIQHARNIDHYERFLHYHCAALLEQVVSSQDYRPKLSVYTIVVLTSGDRYGVDMATIDFDPKDRYGKPLNIISHKVLYLCPKYVDESTPEPYREWLLAIQDSLDEEVNEENYKIPEIQSIFDLIQKDLTTPKERARMKDEYSAELLLHNEYSSGLKLGLKQGIEEGIEKGIEKGIAQGIEKTRKDNALKMLNSGIALDVVADITGYSAETLEKWL